MHSCMSPTYVSFINNSILHCYPTRNKLDQLLFFSRIFLLIQYLFLGLGVFIRFYHEQQSAYPITIVPTPICTADISKKTFATSQMVLSFDLALQQRLKDFTLRE